MQYTDATGYCLTIVLGDCDGIQYVGKLAARCERLQLLLLLIVKWSQYYDFGVHQNSDVASECIITSFKVESITLLASTRTRIDQAFSTINQSNNAQSSCVASRQKGSTEVMSMATERVIFTAKCNTRNEDLAVGGLM